jgi:hypothetical protein
MSAGDEKGQLLGVIADTEQAVGYYQLHQSEARTGTELMDTRVEGLEGLEAIIAGVQRAADLADTLATTLDGDATETEAEYGKIKGSTEAVQEIYGRAGGAEGGVGHGSDNTHAVAMLGHYTSALEASEGSATTVASAGEAIKDLAGEMTAAKEELERAIGRFASLEGKFSDIKEIFGEADDQEGEAVTQLKGAIEEAQQYYPHI